MLKPRRTVDGNIMIPRPDEKTERYLDSKYYRIHGSLYWLPKYDKQKDVSTIFKEFKNRHITIIGKGPSLDNVIVIQKDSVVVCINDSIHRIEQLELTNRLFCIQQDVKLKNSCQPKRATMLVSAAAACYYAKYSNTYTFLAEQYHCRGAATAVLLVKILQTAGAKSLEFVAFDACTTGNTDYADCIGYDPGLQPERFCKTKTDIERVCTIPYTFRK